MMNKEPFIESVSRDPALKQNSCLIEQRMLTYKKFALAFSYPDDDFFKLFPQLSAERERLVSDYDRIFRTGEVWLYGTEHLARNEFQRANDLSDIMGFYRAFGVEPDKDRPDSLSSELEFMHYLIFKMLHALKAVEVRVSQEKASICLDAQKKFFAIHLYPAARRITEEIISKWNSSFYAEVSQEMQKFLDEEKGRLEV